MSEMSIYRMRCSECEMFDECRPTSIKDCQQCAIDDIVGIKHANEINNRLHNERMN
jgi:hypothetical protein